MIWLVALGGGAGAVARFVVDSLLARLPFPATLVINVLGSLLVGLLVGGLAGRSEVLIAVLGTGFCGGFTTFSTASVEVVRLRLAEGRWAGWRYAAASLVGSVLAAGLGLTLGRLAG